MEQNAYELIAKLSPADKVEAMEAMGFMRYRPDHRGSCMLIRGGSGYICTCSAAPTSYWLAPNEVSDQIGESYAERKAYAHKRLAWDEESGKPRLEPWGI